MAGAMKVLVAAASLVAAPQASAQAASTPIIVSGTCDPKSGVTISTLR